MNHSYLSLATKQTQEFACLNETVELFNVFGIEGNFPLP